MAADSGDPWDDIMADVDFDAAASAADASTDIPAEPESAPAAAPPPPTPPVGGDGDTGMATIDLAALGAAIGDAVATAVKPIGDQVGALADKVAELDGKVSGSGSSEEDEAHAVNLAFLAATEDVKNQFEKRDKRKKERAEAEHQVRLAVGLDAPDSPSDTPPDNGLEEWGDDRIIAYYREHRKMPDSDKVCITPAQSTRLIPVIAEIHNGRRTKRRIWEREPRTL